MAKKTADFEIIRDFLEKVRKDTEAAAENAAYFEKIESVLNDKEIKVVIQNPKTSDRIVS